MRAVWSTKDGHTIKEGFERPNPGRDEILIENYYVASNPKDWKLPVMIPNYEAIEGSDTAGVVAAVGPGVTEFSVGDRVAAMTQIKGGDRCGTNAELSVAPALSTFALSDDTKFQDAAAVPLAAMTAALALFVALDLPKPLENSSKQATTLVVNGAASSVGCYASQLAKLANLQVIGIASNEQVAKENGADAFVSYRGKSHAEIIKQVHAAAASLSDEPLVYVFDAVSDADSEILVTEILKKQGGKIATVWPARNPTPANVKTTNVRVSTVLNDDMEFGRKYYRLFGKWLESGQLRANKVKLMSGGLDDIPHGLDLLKQGILVSLVST